LKFEMFLTAIVYAQEIADKTYPLYVLAESILKKKCHDFQEREYEYA
jgi:hypothetical protein